MSGSKRHRSIRNKVAEKFREQNGACYWCGFPMILGEGPYSCIAATYDHLEKRVYGQQRTLHVAAHRVCNNTRHHNSAPHPDAFKRVVKAIQHTTPRWFIMERMDKSK